MSRPKLGVLLGSMQDPTQLLDAARAAEQVGFDEIWVGEDYFMTGGFTLAAAVLSATTLPVGIGILPAVARHPALAAMEISTLANLFPGRLMAGIGSGVPEWLDQMGLRPRSPLGSVRDALAVLRRMLGGETVTAEHPTFTVHEARLEHPPAVVPPLMIGASGPKALTMSGEIADGSILSVLGGVEYVRWARDRVRDGGAGEEHRLTTFTFYSQNESPFEAREAIRPTFAEYLLVGPRNPMTTVQGIADEAERLAALEGDDGVGAIPAEWISAMAVAGTAQDCREGVRRLGDAGSDAVVLAFPAGGTLVNQIRQAGATLVGDRASGDALVDAGQDDAGLVDAGLVDAGQGDRS